VKILFNNNEMKVRRKFWESYDYGIKILYSFSVNFKLSGTYKRKRSCPFYGILALNWPTDKGSYGHVRGAR